MEDLFLCPECSKLGYCKKYARSSSTTPANFDEEFYKKVNEVKSGESIQRDSKVEVSTKISSLQQIRALYTKEMPVVTVEEKTNKNFMDYLFVVPEAETHRVKSDGLSFTQEKKISSII